MTVIDSAVSPDLDPLPCTGARARRLTRRMTAFYEVYLRQVGLRLPQYSLLMHLDREPQSLQRLAERMDMDRTTLTRALKPLASAGWVEQGAGDDARLRLFALTEAGLGKRAQAHAAWAVAQRALEDVLDRDFTARLNAQLEDALERLRPALPPEN